MLWRHVGTPHFGAAGRGEPPTPAHRDVLVLSGGGLFGAAQVGMLRALARTGWSPDVIVGTSAGALNGAWMAAGFDHARVNELENIWLGLRERGVFPDGHAAQVWRVLARRAGVQGDDTLRKLIDKCCPVDDLCDFDIPVHVSATDLHSGEAVWFEEGPAATALLASASVPGVVPPVHHEGRTLVDGGVVANVPVSRAVELGATRIVCLDVSGDLGREITPKTALGVLLHSYTACRIALANHELQQASRGVDALWRIRPDVPHGLRATQWRRIPELIEIGEVAGEAFVQEYGHELARPQVVDASQPVVPRARRAVPTLGIPAGLSAYLA